MKKFSSSNIPGKKSMDDALNRFADLMIEKIENLQQDWRKPWFTKGTVTWPKNFNGREYNGMNALMLTFFCEKEHFSTGIFSTFDNVRKMNYVIKDGVSTRSSEPEVHVLKGQKGFPVLFFTYNVKNEKTGDRIDYSDYRNMSEDRRKEYKVFPTLKTYTVFNIDQTNIKDERPELYDKIISGSVKDIPQLNPDDFSFDPVDRMIREDSWICPIKPTYGDEAYYSIAKNEIVIPEKSQFIDGEAFYSNLFHEMTHSTGSKEYLDRLTPSSFGSEAYAREELVAELTAALIANNYGMEKHVKEDSAAYLKNWLGSLKKSPDFIKTVLLDVKKASYILSNKIESMSNIKSEAA